MQNFTYWTNFDFEREVYYIIFYFTIALGCTFNTLPLFFTLRYYFTFHVNDWSVFAQFCCSIDLTNQSSCQ